MHQRTKDNQLYCRCPDGMKVHIGVDSETGLIHSVETTVANVHAPDPDKFVIYAVAAGFCEAVVGYQGIEKRSKMQG